MDAKMLVPVLIVVAILVVVVVPMILRRRRSEQLKQRFGGEYVRTVQQVGDFRRAEALLEERTRRVERFPIRPLTSTDREGYSIEWAHVQRRFVDDPAAAVNEADRLVTRLMTDRGYPMANFEQRAADLSVSYPAVVQNYRAAHHIQRRSEDAATTEELRRAMVHYRSLFEELLETATVTAIDSRKGVVHGRAS